MFPCLKTKARLSFCEVSTNIVVAQVGKLPVVSLFSGVGGLELGLSKLDSKRIEALDTIGLCLHMCFSS